MNGEKIARELLRLAKDLVAESISREEAFKRYNEGERSGEVYGAFMENRIPWFKEIVRKYEIGITPSDLKKAKKLLRKVTTSNPRDIANGIVDVLMTKEGKSGFARRVEFMRKVEPVAKKMTDAELFVIRHMMKNV